MIRMIRKISSRNKNAITYTSVGALGYTTVQLDDVDPEDKVKDSLNK
jgi:hypothetical protein